jgi:NADH dehydrogenase
MFRSLGTMASLGHTRAVALVMGVPLTGFIAWWLRRTYYLLQMPRWDRRLRIVLDWTVALLFRPDITRVDLRVEREQVTLARQLVERSAEISARGR